MQCAHCRRPTETKESKKNLPPLWMFAITFKEGSGLDRHLPVSEASIYTIPSSLRGEEDRRVVLHVGRTSEIARSIRTSKSPLVQVDRDIIDPFGESVRALHHVAMC